MSLLCIFGHKWLIHEEGPIVGTITGRETGRWFLLRCERCGDLTDREIRPTTPTVTPYRARRGDADYLHSIDG